MRDVSEREGRTVLFVSHNLGAIADLTSRALFLHSGTLSADGEVKEVISSYLSQASNKSIYKAERTKNASVPHLKRVEVITSEPNGIHKSKRSLEIRILVSHQQPMPKACLRVVIVNQFQSAIVQAQAYYSEVHFGNKPGETLLICRFPSLRLNVGHYYLRTHLTEPPGLGVYETLSDLCPFEVIRIEDTVLWGWNPSTCAYFEDSVWTVGVDERASLAAELPASG